MSIHNKFLFTITFFAIIFINTICYGKTTEHTLKNGIKVLLIQDEKSLISSFQIWYKVGSRDEPAGKTGISHLLEHMMFKGTQKYGSKEFSNLIQKNGGIDNAFTTKAYTMYFQNLPSDKIHLSIELEADRMQNLLLDSKEVVSERAVVMEERRLRYEDDPQNMLYEDTVAVALKSQSYRHPIIGWMSDIASIEREDLYKHYKTYYSPDNAFIVVAGKYDKEYILNLLEQHFGTIKPHKEKINRIETVEPKQNGERRLLLKKEAQLPYVLIAYQVPNYPNKDSFALEVLSVILSSGKSSRLYKSLVYEKKIALNAFASYSGFYKQPFLFLLGGTASQNNSGNDIEKALLNEIEMIKKEEISPYELQKAKNQIESSFILSQDSAHSKGLYTGIFEILGDWRQRDKYLDHIRAVTQEDIKRVANKYFSEDTRTVEHVIPQKLTQ
ncbi:MAG: insulinase family protein [Thermodesulfovibrionales bacterium]|nr:insulinase family protein [Thermodesulfovibrionales bacterium]